MSLKWNDEMLLAFKKIMEIDKRFENLFDQIGSPENRAIKEGFQSLAKIIIGQQISTIVAKKIYDKLIKDNMLNEQNLAKTSIENLKLYGLSSQKSHYLSNLASLVNNKDIDIGSFKYMPGEDLTNLLIKIKGIGQWTINNYKIFALQDIDAWPSADLALQEAVKIIKQLNNRPNQDEMEKIGKTWKPYRGAAALFLWHLYNKVKVEKRTLYYV
jgi:DNA-3-methyladenine glycosylase II